MDYFSCAFNAFVLPHPRLHVLSEADECRAYRRGLSEPGVSVENHLISTSEPSCNASLKVYLSPVSQHTVHFSYPNLMLHHNKLKV